jgi:sialate O-acetylesterase
MAVLNDIGDAIDIHPRNKVDAGKRLSLWAFRQAYGYDIIPSGPLYKSHKIEGNKFVISFGCAGEGLMVGKKNLMDPTVPADGPLKRFQICGADKVWKWADAKITSKDTVEVSHKDITAPIEVRYAWSPNPEGANLYNKAGLPTSVFKTSK